jgi:hypothetical protein
VWVTGRSREEVEPRQGLRKGTPGDDATRAASSRTSAWKRASCERRRTSTGSVTASGTRLWLTTQAKGRMSARSEVALQRRGLVHRRRLRQRHQQDLRERRIAQARQQAAHLLGRVPARAQHLAVVRLGRVEQEQRVAGGRGVDDHEAVLALVHDAREGAEDRDLLGAGAAQVLFEQRAPGGVEPAPAVRITSSA